MSKTRNTDLKSSRSSLKSDHSKSPFINGKRNSINTSITPIGKTTLNLKDLLKL